MGSPVAELGAEFGENRGERLAPDGAEEEDVREDGAEGERLRRLAEGIDEGVVPRTAVADAAHEAQQCRPGAL